MIQGQNKGSPSEYTAAELGALAGDTALRNDPGDRSTCHVAKGDTFEKYEAKIDERTVDQEQMTQQEKEL